MIVLGIIVLLLGGYLVYALVHDFLAKLNNNF